MPFSKARRKQYCCRIVHKNIEKMLAYSFSLFFFFFLVGLLIEAAFNPLVFAEVMRLWQ